MAPTPSQYILLLLSGFALYATFYFSHANGTLGMSRVRELTRGPIPAVMPLPDRKGSEGGLRTVYTGIDQVDRLLAVLTVFFWAVFDGSNPALTLHAVDFAGVFGAAWTLVMLEGWRRGNAWTIVAFPVLFGIVAQLMTFACALPLYAGLHLLVSTSTSSRPNVHSIAVPRSVLYALPLIFTVGYTLPSVLMLLRTPTVVSEDVKQILIAIWQPWPVYVSALAVVSYGLLSRFINDQSTDKRGNERLALRRAFRLVYAFAFAQAAIGHLVSWIVSLATVLAPEMFDERYITLLHPRRVHGVTLPWQAADLRVRSVGEGVQLFLQWDFMIGSVGTLLWAATLYVLAHRHLQGRVGWIPLMGKMAMLVVVSGPVATAVEMIWERDELVLEYGVSVENKAN